MAIKITVNSNIDEVAKRLDRTAAQVDEAVEAGIKAVAKDVADIVDKRAARIYKRTVPRKKLRKATRQKLNTKKRTAPQWERSGDLREGVGSKVIEYPSRREAELAVRGRAAKYARRRHELGESWTPKNPAGGVIRHNPFFKEAVNISKPKIQPVFESAFKAKLGI